MRIAVFDSKRYDHAALETANQPYGYELTFFEDRLNRHTTPLVAGFDVVCPFVNDKLDRTVITELKRHGVGLVALRCAGFNGVDLVAAAELGIPVTRVPRIHRKPWRSMYLRSCSRWCAKRIALINVCAKAIFRSMAWWV